MTNPNWNKKDQRRKQFEDRLAKADKLSSAIKSGNLDALSSMISKGSDALGQPDANGDNDNDKKSSDSSETQDTCPTGPVSLEDVCPGEEIVVSTAAGEESEVYVIRRTLADAIGEDAHIAAEFYNIMRGSREYFHELESSAELCCIADANPENILFMDTETCGLKDSAIFLTGIMYYDAGDLVFEQFLARDLSQEAGMLQMFSDRLAAAGVLVTFNGAKFDMPLIRQRCLLHGVRLPAGDGPGDNRMPPHLDLLKEARRLWKGRLPNCRLGTIERRILQRQREGDIASRAIPAAYKRFTQSDDATEMQAILHHNLIDMLSMAQLVCLFLTGCDPLIDA